MIVTGTSPINPQGGIGVAMQGYLDTLEAARIPAVFVPSYEPTGLHGSVLKAVNATLRIRQLARDARCRGRVPVVYAHAGRGLGTLRQSLVVGVARRAGAVILFHLHNSDLDRYLDSALGRRLLHACLAPAHVVCVLTSYWRERVRAALPSVNVRIVPNPLNAELEAVARRTDRPPINSDSIELLTMTRLVGGKGVDDALRVLAVLPDRFRLVVAGDGPDRAAYQQLAQSLGIAERVRFAGWVDGAEKERLLRRASIFLLPSRRDSFGMGFIEAMAHGVPVVGLAWGSIPCVVPHGVAGLLVTDAAPSLLAEAVAHLADVERNRRMGINARRWVLREFSREVVAGSIVEAVQGAISMPQS